MLMIWSSRAPEQIVRSRRPVLLRSHRPLRCTTESWSAAKGNPQTKIARFGGLKPPIPAISNAAATGKLTPAQSLRALFTDDYITAATQDDIKESARELAHAGELLFESYARSDDWP